MSTCHFDIWTHDVSLPAHGQMIFTATSANPVGGCQPGTGSFDTSDIGANGGGSSCTQDNVIPQVTVSVNGKQSAFTDSGQVLNTGGIDKATCGTGGNESEQWTPIGQAPCPGSSLSLAPASQAAAPGGTATFTARFTNGCKTPLAGVPVQLAVTTGPDAGTTVSGTTNTKGQATLRYTGSGSGVDYASASITNTAGTITSTTAHVLWETATLVVTPASGLPGSPISFTGTGYGASEKVTLYYSSPSGPVLTTVTATSGGAISGSFTLPVPAGGAPPTSIAAVGATSGKEGWAAFSASCTTDWNNPAGGNFNTAADWTGGAVPAASDLACVILPGTYSVTMNQSNEVAGLVLGSATGTQTLTIPGGNSALTLDGASTIASGGVLSLGSSDGNWSMVQGGGTLTNHGTLTTLQGNGGTRYIRVNLVNSKTGVIKIGDFDTRVDSGTTLTNDGTLTVSGGGAIALSGNSTFDQAGGTVTGTVAISSGGALADTGGTGGRFLMECGSNTLSGTIAKKQAVILQGNGCGNDTTTLAGTSVTNNGTFTMDSTNGNYALISGSPLVNNGTFSVAQDNGGPRYLRADITNSPAGTVKIADFSTLMDSGNTLTNDGTVSVTDGATLALYGGSAYSQGAAATLGVTVDAAAGSAYGLYGNGSGTVSVGGTLDVTTVGTPGAGSSYIPISVTTLTGQFATISSTVSYTPSYTATSLTLTAR